MSDSLDLLSNKQLDATSGNLMYPHKVINGDLSKRVEDLELKIKDLQETVAELIILQQNLVSPQNN